MHSLLTSLNLLPFLVDHVVESVSRRSGYADIAEPCRHAVTPAGAACFGVEDIERNGKKDPLVMIDCVIDDILCIGVGVPETDSQAAGKIAGNFGFHPEIIS